MKRLRWWLNRDPTSVYAERVLVRPVILNRSPSIERYQELLESERQLLGIIEYRKISRQAALNALRAVIEERTNKRG